MFTSSGCARRSTPGRCAHMIETVRGAGYRLAHMSSHGGCRLTGRSGSMSWFLPRVLAGLGAMALGRLASAADRRRDGAVPADLARWRGLRVAAIALFDRLQGLRLLKWLRGGQEGRRRATPACGVNSATGSSAPVRGTEQRARIESERLSQFLSAIEASPNGVLLIDAGDQIEWCNSSAADHFALDPQRDRRQRITNLVRSPAFVDYLQAGRFDEPLTFRTPRGPGTLLGHRPALRRRHEARAVAGQDRAGTGRRHAARLRRQRLARDPHPVDRPLRLPGDDDQPAVDRARAGPDPGDDDAAGAAHGHPGQRPADPRAARRQPETTGRSLGRGRCLAERGRGRCQGAVGGPSHAALPGPALAIRSRARRPSC